MSKPVIIVNPTTVAFIRTVERENLRIDVTQQSDAVQRFARRIAERWSTPDMLLIVVLWVDDPDGGALADLLMPGHDWSEIRSRGETPIARGLADRIGMQRALDAAQDAASQELRNIDGIAVLAAGRGVIAAFAIDDVLPGGTHGQA